MSTHDLAAVHLAIAVSVIVTVAMIGVTIWFSERSYRALRHAVIHGVLELQRGTKELQRGTERLQEGQAEIKRLEIVIGGMVYQEDEMTRALITARFEEMLARLPR